MTDLLVFTCRMQREKKKSVQIFTSIFTKQKTCVLLPFLYTFYIFFLVANSQKIYVFVELFDKHSESDNSM